MTGSKINLTLEFPTLYVRWDFYSKELYDGLRDMGFGYAGSGEVKAPYSLSLAQRAWAYAKHFGRVVGNRDLIDAARSSRNEMVELEAILKGDSDAPIAEALIMDSPEAAKALRPYQRAGVHFIATRPATLLADHPGSGKTLQAIAGLISAEITGDILVLAPSIATQVTWPAEIAKWAPQDEIIKCTGTRKQREAALGKLQIPSPKKRRWVLCNLEMAKAIYHRREVTDEYVRKAYWELHYPELYYLDYSAEKPQYQREWASILVDESHRALITDKSQPWAQTQQRAGIGKLSVHPSGKRIALSGTPFRGKLENTWGTLNWLDGAAYSSYWDWVNIWFRTGERRQFIPGGNSIMKHEIFGLKEGVNTEFYDSLKPLMIRRTKREIAPWLPAKQYAGSIPSSIDTAGMSEEERRYLVGHWIEMPPKQKRSYQQMEKDALSQVKDGIIVANGILAEMIRLKQFSGCYGRAEQVDGETKYYPELPSNKFDWLVEFLDSLGINKDTEGIGGEDTQKVVVASQFTQTIDLFHEKLKKKGISALRITGKVKADDRAKAVENFQSDEGAKVLLLNTKAGGVALTLDRADDLVILDETFIPDDQEQVEDRIHRVSRDHNVTIHYVRSLGTIEEKIAKVTAFRDVMQKRILDEERGVDFVREILE